MCAAKGLNIWLVNPFDGLPGESLRPGRYAFLSRYLAERGHRVTWWSSNFCHPTKSFRTGEHDRTQVAENLEIILVRTPRYDRNVSLQRIFNHWSYARGFQKQGGSCREAPDVIIASAPPLLAANAALTVAGRFGAGVIIDVQDVWPEQFEALVPASLAQVAGLLFLPVKRLADRAYDMAHGITAVSNTYLARALSVSAEKSKGSVVPLGVDMKLYRHCLDSPDVDTRYVKRDPGEFWAVYIGTIGRSYDIRTILDAAGGLSADYPRMRFIIAGDGPQASEMQRYACRMALPNVTFTGMMPYSHLTHLMSQCDVGLSAYTAECRPSMPNKCFDYMAAGLPMINSNKGELETLIGDEGIGLQYRGGDAPSLKTALVRLYNSADERLGMGARARSLAEERFDMQKTYGRFEEMAIALSNRGGG